MNVQERIARIDKLREEFEIWEFPDGSKLQAGNVDQEAKQTPLTVSLYGGRLR